MSARHISVTEVVVTIAVGMRRTMDVMRMSIDAVMVAMSTGIISVRMIMTRMSTMIVIIDARHIVIEKGEVVIDLMDTEQPAACYRIDRTEEVIEAHEGTILNLGHDVTEVIVTPIQILVIAIYGIVMAINHTIHDRIDRLYEVVVDLVAIFVLLGGELEFVCHTIAEETCLLANLIRRQGPCLHGSSHCHDQGKENFLHFGRSL